MKYPFFTAAILVAGASLLRADDVAQVTFKYSRDKKSRHQVIIEFYEGDAPQTVANFKKLAQKGFYKGLTVHRAFPHTLIQTGDPLSAHTDRSKIGTGGPGYTLPPEIRRKNIKGAVAAARLPDKINPTRLSNGSQFYICLKPMPSYDGQYTVFGQVVSGMDTLDEISMKPVDSNDNPIERIVIDSVKILPREKLPQLPPAPAPVLVASAKTAKSAPVTPPPAPPGPIKPAPANPAPAKPALAKAAPVAPAPATPPAVKTKPWWKIWPSAGAPAPTKPASATPAPTPPAPAKSAAVKPALPKPTPAKPAPRKPKPVTPAPATPAPETPPAANTKPWWKIWPSAGAPGAPAPAKPAAATPAPTPPAPAKSAATKPALAKPTPAKPAPKKPKPVTPAPATPAPATPAPAKTKPWWQIF